MTKYFSGLLLCVSFSVGAIKNLGLFFSHFYHQAHWQHNNNNKKPLIRIRGREWMDGKKRQAIQREHKLILSSFGLVTTLA